MPSPFKKRFQPLTGRLLRIVAPDCPIGKINFLLFGINGIFGKVPLITAKTYLSLTSGE